MLARYSMAVRPLDLLLLSSSFAEIGGRVNTTGRALAHELANAGHRVHLVSTDGRAAHTRVSASITLTHLGSPLSADGSSDGFFEAFSQLPQPDMIHALDWASAFAAIKPAQSWQISLFASASVLPVHPKDPHQSAVAEAQATVAERAKVMISTSQYAASKTVVRCGAEARRIVVVPPGVDSELFHPLRPGFDPTRKQPYIFAAGGDDPVCIELLLASLAAIPTENRPELVLVKANREVAALAKKHKVSVKIIPGVTQSQYADLVRCAAIALVPKADALSLLTLEAQASAVPVLVGPDGGAIEAIIDGQTGYVVDSQDPDTWTEAICALLRDRKEALRLGRNGRELALATPWSVTAGRLEELYYANLRR